MQQPKVSNEGFRKQTSQRYHFLNQTLKYKAEEEILNQNSSQYVHINYLSKGSYTLWDFIMLCNIDDLMHA